MYDLNKEVRALTLSISNLESEYDEIQLDIFNMLENTKKQNDIKNKKLEKVAKVLDNMKNKFGSDMINFGSFAKKD